MMEIPELPAWMGDVDPSQIGFPFAVDKRLYRKRIGLPYKETPLGPLLLDAYAPIDPGPHPLVVMIHGGAWARGGRFEMGLSKWAGYLAGGGLAVVSIDYRLAPGTTYPDSFQDCIDAVDWAVEHADDLGVDGQRVGLWGDSAGGHLALLLATSQTNPKFRGPRLRCSPDRLEAVVALYAPTDLLRLHRASARAGNRDSTVRDFVGADPEADPQRWRDVAPIEQAHPALPPMLLLHGTRDLLVPHSQAVRFAEKLSALGASYELHIVENGVHGFDRIAPTEEAKRLIEYARKFLAEALGVSA